jgi:Domain of unknown function (DUF4215)
VLVRTLPFLLALGLAAAGCAKDTVGPDAVAADASDAVCGNGIVEPGEACDVSSPGCVQCRVAPGWTCTDNVCNAICGDGVVGSGPDCEDPERDTACDVTGYWAEREVDWSRDAVVGALQAQSDWHLLHFTQTGDTFVVDGEIDCGLLVTGPASKVTFDTATLKGLMYINRMDGKRDPGVGGVVHAAVQGTSKEVAGGCEMTMQRHYIQRGLSDSWLPNDFNAGTPLSELQQLPSVSDPVNGTEWPQGATDPDGDGIPGAAFQVTGAVGGTRNSVQRQWRQYATVAGKPIPAHALEIEIPGDYDLQENVLRVTNCGNQTDCSLLASGSVTANDPQPYDQLKFLGRTLGSTNVSAVVTAPLRQDINDDLATCANVQKALPADSSTSSGKDGG